MSLPPLPEPNVEYVSGHRDPIVSYDKEQMQAYGQACREAGLEEAAVGLETGDVSTFKDDAYMLSYTTHLLVSFAKYFRSLK